MSDKAKVIGVVSAILGLLAAGLVLLTRHQEFKKSSAEADVAEQRRRPQAAREGEAGKELTRPRRTDAILHDLCSARRRRQ